MQDHERVREMERAVRRVMKAVETYESIGKSEFEDILNKVIDEVQLSTGIDRGRVAAITPKVIDDMLRQFGPVSDEQRSWDALIGYLYTKHMRALGAW